MRWLDPGPFPTHIGFTSSRRSYAGVMRQWKVEAPHPFVVPGSQATTHMFQRSDGVQCVVVTLDLEACKGASADDIRYLLVHEAVHVGQHIRRCMVDNEPSVEVEAYVVQWVSRWLWECWEKR